jgi:ATP-binding cassette subfamily D (ALD) long-chain fatty acid import protein
LTLSGDGTGSWTFSRIANASQTHDEGQETIGESEPTAEHTEESTEHLTRVLEEIHALEARIEESRGWEKRVKELGEALKAK